MTLVNLAAVMAGGALGAGLRYWVVSLVLSSYVIKLIPYASLATLAVNVIGSFIIGFLAYVLTMRGASEGLKMFFIVGLLGSFTTVSAFSLETLEFILKADYVKALINIVLMLLFCVFATWIGMLIGKNFIKLL